MKKALVLLLTFGLSVGTLAGCGGTSEAAGGDGIIDVCIASEPQSIDPALNSAVDGAIMIQHAFEGLVKWVDDGEGNGTLAPGMAESWEMSEDGITWTFKIRDGAVWSDGKPVVAGDFLYAWNRLIAPETAADYSYMLAMVDGYDEGKLNISAPDDSTFIVNLNASCSYFEEICAFPATYPIREDIVKENGDKWTFEPATYVSNGPYTMTEWVHNSAITMQKSDTYYDADKISAPTIKFHLMDDVNAQYAAFRSGELDFIEQVPTEETQALLDSGELQVVDHIGTYYVCFNTKRAPFDDPRVREAFSLVIDRNFIVEKITGTGQVPAEGFVPSGMYDAGGVGKDDFRTIGGSYYSAAAEDYTANCDRARTLLAEAGFKDGTGFPVVEYLYNTSEGHKAIAEALQNMWQTELGVSVTLQNQDWAVFLQERKAGNYSIARNGWIADYNDPMCFLDMWITGGGNNDAQYSNPEYDALINKAVTTGVQSERMKYMHEAEDILIGKDHTLAPIYFYTQSYMINPNLQGMYYTPLGFFFWGTSTLQ